ncbi:MAG: DNA primase DnaG, partial [Candidatus Woesearchaeota archaeon]
MAKISPVSGKYIVNATIKIEGVVDRPDIIGAIFGQTEGLLGSDLELRELQRSGRIGRIEVQTESKGGITQGTIVIPSSLDKAETVIVAAALEVIERIGPCNSHIEVKSIQDVRVSKRKQVVDRAKELLKKLQDSMMPDSQELAEQVAESVRVMEIQEYGKEKLPSGPAIDESEEIIVVEGRADVVNLLKHGFKNVISMNGASTPKTIIELSKTKTITLFVDGDRGGILNVKEMIAVADIEFVVKAPDGKEVEELTKKEIHKALRTKLTPEQMKSELAARDNLRSNNRNSHQKHNRNSKNDDRKEIKRDSQKSDNRSQKPATLTKDDEAFYKEMLEDLVGSHAAVFIDKEKNVLGRVPVSEVASTIGDLDGGVRAVVIDGTVT